MSPTPKRNISVSHQSAAPADPTTAGPVFLWNHHLAAAASTSVFRDPNFPRFTHDAERASTSSTPLFSSSMLSQPHNIVSTVSELEEADEPEELECSDLKPKESLYNIIQNTTNLHEKRGPKFLCRECRLATHTRLSMITHMKMHLKPFCEVCFAVFDAKDAVRNHIETVHPDVIIRDRTPTPVPTDYYSLQTVAPPNTPTPMSDDEMAAIEGLINPIMKVPIHVTVLQKLAGHEDADASASTEDEQRLVIDDSRSKSEPSRGRAKKKRPALKRQTKKTNRSKAKDVTVSDNVMKKITSRFGRSISLKMPQF